MSIMISKPNFKLNKNKCPLTKSYCPCFIKSYLYNNRSFFSCNLINYKIIITLTNSFDEADHHTEFEGDRSNGSLDIE